MSFIAYSEKEHINKKRAEDITPKEQNNTFYCQNPKCNCEFTVSALNSNRIRTHFVKKPTQPILIYAEWNYNYAEITSKKQIVPLKKSN